MKTIKKSTILIAAITAMAALAVPSMASAVVWGPVNTNQSLDATNVNYSEYGGYGLTWTCATQHLGVHVRTPASSTLDITSASWSGCVGTGTSATINFTMTPTGLPWTATATSTSVITFPVHVQLSRAPNWVSNIDGTMNLGTWNASTHTVTFSSANPGSMYEYFQGVQVARIFAWGSWHNPTNTLTLA
jgi:hypothetical protein